MDCFVRFAHGFLIRSRHEAESLAFLQIDMRRMSANTKFWRYLFERIELGEEFCFG
jgi:hypothetical protein